MERKQFLIYATTATGMLPLLLTEIACDYYNDSGNGGTGTSNVASFSVTSTISGGHTHSVKILFADVNAPPAGGKSLTTSTTTHFHTLTLSQADFQALSNGQTLTRDTSTDSSHKHTFSITVPAGNTGSQDDDIVY